MNHETPTPAPSPDCDECENCGMIGVPIVHGFCEGCTCNCCGANGSMDAGGQCSNVLDSYQTCRLVGCVRTWVKSGSQDGSKKQAVLKQLAYLDNDILGRFPS